jgi:hypothetical protein
MKIWRQYQSVIYTIAVVLAAAVWYDPLLPNDLTIFYLPSLTHGMHASYTTEAGKNAIKKTGDHNLDMERMQFQKERGNVSGENDYVNLETKAGRAQGSMGSENGEMN